jgi:nucleoside-diphosphate-sugar epimerase
MKVLITGSSGFVGSHFRKKLDDGTNDLLCLDVKDGVVLKEFLNTQDCREYFRANNTQFDLVIHCAAVVGGRTMIENSPFLLAAEDLSIDAEMWRWAERTKPKYTVFFSSSAAYPIAFQRSEYNISLREDHIDLDAVRNPDFTYGWVKLTGEMMAREYSNLGLKVLVLRPFSGYGETQDMCYPFPSFAWRAAVKESPFAIWGDGTQVRDWVHIDDIVDAVLTMHQQDVAGLAVNISTGVGTSFNELASMMMKEAGYSAPLHHLLDAPKGVMHRVGCPDRLNSFYTPRVTLEEGIRRCIKHFLH